MTEQPNKIDITDNVHGKMIEGGFTLHFQEEQIGHVQYNDGVPTFELADGYEAEGQRVYQVTGQDPTQVNAYVYHCDKGWC